MGEGQDQGLELIALGETCAVAPSMIGAKLAVRPGDHDVDIVRT